MQILSTFALTSGITLSEVPFSRDSSTSHIQPVSSTVSASPKPRVVMAGVPTRNPEVMTIPQALTMATRDSAAVIGLAHKIGQLTPGYLADIILIDLSGAHHQPLHSLTASLVYNARASDVQTVIVNGEIIMRDRRLLTLDKAEIIRQVNRSMARLAQRVPGKRIQVYNP